MRQVRKTSSGDAVRSGFPKEGMSEGPAKGRKNFSEDEIAYIKKRRAELILEGKRDKQVANVLAGETNRSVFSIDEKTRRLVEGRELEENPNKQEKSDFSKEDVTYLMWRRAELIEKGKKDNTIGKLLAGKMKRSADSINKKLRELVENGELGGNPNKREQEGFSEEDIACITKRRAALILEGKNDGQIAGILAGKMKMPAKSVEARLYWLVKSGELGENPNKREQRGFSEEDIACITKRRAELILEGKKDSEIARILAKEMKRSAGSIKTKIHRIIGSGELEENANRMSGFSEEELAYIKKRRAVLILEGKKDWNVSDILAGEMKRSANSIEQKIRALIKCGDLEESPNKDAGFSEEEVAQIRKKRAELILEGKTDNAIAGVLACEMERSAGSIREKIHALVESGGLGENPNKKGRKFSDEELAVELSAAVDMYLGDSP